MHKVIKYLDNRYILFVILCLVTFFAWRGFLSPGYFSVHDDIHIAWLFEMEQALKSGQFPPRFAPDLSYGYGYPLFVFVYPLPFYFGQLFRLFGLSFVDSVKMVMALSVVASALSMYSFIALLTKKNAAALAGAIVYVYTPYRAVDLFVRGAFGEAVAFAIMPLPFYAFTKLAYLTDPVIEDRLGGSTLHERTSNRVYMWIAISAITLALLVLVHNIAAFMIMPFFGLYLLLLLFCATDKVRVLLYFFTSSMLGALLSCYFWLPALVESKLMVADTIFTFVDHFPFIKQLIIPSWGYGISVWGPYDGMSFQLGLVNLGLILFALLVLIIKRNVFTRYQWLLIGWMLFSFGVGLFLMNIRSAFLWQTFPIFQYFQFPWRFLLLETFIMALFIVPLAYALPSKYLTVVSLVFGGASLLFTSMYFVPQAAPSRFDAYFINRYIAVKNLVGKLSSPSAEYRLTAEEYLRLPRVTETRPLEAPITRFTGNADIAEQKDSDVAYRAQIKATGETPVTFAAYQFPGWQVLVDGVLVPTQPAKPYGTIQFSVPDGNHSVQVLFKESTLRKTANIITLSSIVVIGLLLGYGFSTYQKRSRPNENAEGII